MSKTVRCEVSVPLSHDDLLMTKPLLHAQNVRSITPAQPVELGVCYGYIMGAIDGETNAAAERFTFGSPADKYRGGPQTDCISGSVTNEQLKDIVVKYLRNNPQMRHTTAASQLTVALVKAFPCRRN